MKDTTLSLAIKILRGLKERIILECWDNEAEYHPSMNQTIHKLSYDNKHNRKLTIK
ncbi:8847_t:CDS:2 [Funneliformis geosporum]|uniref:8847_t:CDS:1 n=1 Tax=Funneliformis geosporum TaxID=1117311 RepID=A0A9W4SSX8_9GLOM|nr:8847_t:CDS:2 [Funneliformis geosporum]